jgi:anti-sigma-K factor RskA
MTLSNQQFPYPSDHPEDLFDAYVLGSLEEEERDTFEAHLESCESCLRGLEGWEETSALFAQSVPQFTPPGQLRASIMEAVDALPPVFSPPSANTMPGASKADPAPRFTLSSFAMPLAATLVIGLLSASLILNVVTTSRLNSLEQERAATNARLSVLEEGQSAASAGIRQLAEDGQYTNASLQQVMETSYLMAKPFTQPLLLRPTNGRSDSEGVLLVTADGQKAILMLANMDQPQPPQEYQVWLSRNGQELPVGQISVDSSGWGTMALNPPESLYGFDWMNLTVDEPATGGGSGGEMVLQARIISPGAR